MKKSVVFSILIAVVLTIGVIALAMSNLTIGNPDASDVSAESATTTQGDSLTDETVWVTVWRCAGRAWMPWLGLR